MNHISYSGIQELPVMIYFLTNNPVIYLLTDQLLSPPGDQFVYYACKSDSKDNTSSLAAPHTHLPQHTHTPSCPAPTPAPPHTPQQPPSSVSLIRVIIR